MDKTKFSYTINFTKDAEKVEKFFRGLTFEERKKLTARLRAIIQKEMEKANAEN